MGWHLRRTDPYTQIGIRRCKCIRCGAPAVHQWNICSDQNFYRPMCLDCDIELNKLVLKWAGHPHAQRLGDEYERRARLKESMYQDEH